MLLNTMIVKEYFSKNVNTLFQTQICFIYLRVSSALWLAADNIWLPLSCPNNMIQLKPHQFLNSCVKQWRMPCIRWALINCERHQRWQLTSHRPPNRHETLILLRWHWCISVTESCALFPKPQTLPLPKSTYGPTFDGFQQIFMNLSFPQISLLLLSFLKAFLRYREILLVPRTFSRLWII